MILSIEDDDDDDEIVHKKNHFHRTKSMTNNERTHSYESDV
jgi:hypothetical protein